LQEFVKTCQRFVAQLLQRASCSANRPSPVVASHLAASGRIQILLEPVFACLRLSLKHHKITFVASGVTVENPAPFFTFCAMPAVGFFESFKNDNQFDSLILKASPRKEQRERIGVMVLA